MKIWHFQQRKKQAVSPIWYDAQHRESTWHWTFGTSLSQCVVNEFTHFQHSKLCLVLNMSARSSTLCCKCKVPQLLFYVIYFFLYSSAAEYLFKHVYVISQGGLTKGVICLALLGYFHASLSSSLSLSGSSSSLLAVKVVDSSIGPSPCLFRRDMHLCAFMASLRLFIWISNLDLFPDICILFENIELAIHVLSSLKISSLDCEMSLVHLCSFFLLNISSVIDFVSFRMTELKLEQDQLRKRANTTSSVRIIFLFIRFNVDTQL